MCVCVSRRGLLNKFLDIFRIGTFIDSTHMKLIEVIFYCYNALFLPFQQLLEGPMEVLLCEVSTTFVTASFISSILS